MSKKTVRVILSVAVIGLALGGLFYTTLSSDTEYYKHVDEVMAGPQAPETWYGKKLQLHGFVVEKTIMVKQDTLDYRFQIQNNGKVVDAVYRGVVPDTFKDGSEVVLKGQLASDGFHVDPAGVMAKCPSKYDPAKTPTAVSGAIR
jgi:cytochrome c-type biogenesis protein CcmE